MDDFPKLDPREQHFRIPGPHPALKLFLRRLPATDPRSPANAPVLYVHGATFPSALSIAHRFDGYAWRDALNEAGFDVWALDFHGFGYSDRYAQMDQPAEDNAPLCNAADAGGQVEAAARFILEHLRVPRLSLISHSWGSMPAGRFAGEHPTMVDRWVLFGPVARRNSQDLQPAPVVPAWRLVSLEDQWKRFVEDVPPGEPPVLSRAHFDPWGERYLNSDRTSRSHEPAAVRVPAGPSGDILRAWSGQLGYDPAQVQCPVALIRGEWDGVIPDADARWLFDAFKASPVKRDIKISRGTHLLHLETMRFALYSETNSFLLGENRAPHNRADPINPPTQKETAMFAVIFVVQPKKERWDDYLALAKQLKPKLEAIDGFIDNERFVSQTKEGRVLSLSTWRDEKAVVRWRTQGEHHGVQEKGRFEVFEDYHLRVGEITADSAPPVGVGVDQQHYDVTAVGEAKTCTITEFSPPNTPGSVAQPSPAPSHPRLDPATDGLIGHEVFESITHPGKILVLASWRDNDAASAWKPTPLDGGELRRRQVRVIRDYGMFDRREAPQFYPDVEPAAQGLAQPVVIDA